MASFFTFDAFRLLLPLRCCYASEQTFVFLPSGDRDVYDSSSRLVVGID